MTPSFLPFPIPFCFDPHHFRLDDLVSFTVAVLAAITVHAEAQTFMAILLGDTRQDDSKRLHFNPLLHLDIFGVICFLSAGFGWPKSVMICREKFAHPRLFTIFAYLAGPVANFFLASIAGSVIWLYKHFGVEDRVFCMMAAVNLTMAVYHLLPVPPLAGSCILPVLFPQLSRYWPSRTSQTLGAIGLILYFGFERISGHFFIGKTLSIAVVSLYRLFVS